MAAESFTDVRMKGFAKRTPVADVLRVVDERVTALEAERIASVDAAGRVLAQRVVSKVDVPAFAKSAMDGYAVRGSGTLAIIGTALPGSPFGSTLRAGQAIRIMTGAAVPRGAEAIVPVEDAVEAGSTVRFSPPIIRGKHIIAVGEDVAKGRLLMKPGRVLRPQDIGLLAAVGVETVKIVRRPRVAILVTGDELVPPGTKPGNTQTVDSNSPMLAALIQRDGGVHAGTRYVKDDYGAVREAVRTADADVILVTGGSSVGQEDHAPRAVAELGELAVHGIAIKPAGPAGIGFLPEPDRIVFLMPGHPMSCLCAYTLFASVAVRMLGKRCAGLRNWRRIMAPINADVPSAKGRYDYVQVKLVNPKLVEPLPGGASRLSTTVAADGFILVPPEVERVVKGDWVEIFLYDVEPPAVMTRASGAASRRRKE